MNYKEINDILASVGGAPIEDLRFHVGWQFSETKARAPYLELILGDGRKLFVGLRWAKVTGKS